MARIQLYDTTLRDGSQGEGVNFSLQDKLMIATKLDELGFDYIEGGYPLSNPKDEEFFRRAADMEWKHAKITAFGMTRRKDIAASDDVGMQALVNSKAPVITIVGKTSDFHVTEVLGVTLDENLEMIRDTVAYLVGEGREVIYDAEHFFDGWKANPQYAAKTIRAAAEAGASIIVMCDTNGGTLPEEIAALTPDIFVVVAFGKLIPQSTLDLSPLPPINGHASLLPKFRGAAPAGRSIMAGEIETGVSVMQVVKALDAGPVMLVNTLNNK